MPFLGAVRVALAGVFKVVESGWLISQSLVEVLRGGRMLGPKVKRVWWSQTVVIPRRMALRSRIELPRNRGLGKDWLTRFFSGGF